MRVGQTAFLTIAGTTNPNNLSAGERTYYDAITATNIKGKLQSATFQDAGRAETDHYGNKVSARADYGNDGTSQRVNVLRCVF